MKSLLSVMMVTVLMVTAANAQPPAPIAEGHVQGHIVQHSEAIELFTRVKIDDPDNIAPCAVTKIIMVPDPCACHNPCNCCAPKCVAIKICVPPPNPCGCGCSGEPRVKIKRGGRKQEYDYGKYEVEVTVKDGYVEVDYDD